VNATTATTDMPTVAPSIISISSDPPSLLLSDLPSSLPSASEQLCAEYIAEFKTCLNKTMSFDDAELCDDCVAGFFPEKGSVCPVYQSSICTALTRECNCGECSPGIETYIDCALAEAGRDDCSLSCNYDTCDAEKFQFTTCMEEEGYTADGIVSCEVCTRNALSSDGVIDNCLDANGLICPAIRSDCDCGSCHEQLQLYMNCDTVGKEIPSTCTIDCELENMADSGTDDRAGGPSGTSGVFVGSSLLSTALFGFTFFL
jgi:hypothetical protein